MNQNSIEAYRSIENLSGKRQMVYRCIESNQGITRQQIAEFLGWTINRVTGRVTELIDLGLIVDTKEARKGKLYAGVSEPVKRVTTKQQLEECQRLLAEQIEINSNLIAEIERLREVKKSADFAQGRLF
ncbi:MAG: winged helix-turn-helix domain-containing protein [Bacteroidota bacterium]